MIDEINDPELGAIPLIADDDSDEDKKQADEEAQEKIEEHEKAKEE